MSTFTVAITGASGALYGLTLVRHLVRGGHTLFLSISEDGLSIIRDETELKISGSEMDMRTALEDHCKAKPGQIRYFDVNTMYAPIASGSAKVDAMIIIPCSMKTLSAVANGYAANLIERAADVMIKEKRRLIIVPRETPLSVIHLRNMLTLAEAGCHIIPAMPAFYHQPKNIDDLIDFVVGRVLDSLGVEHDLVPRWGS